MAQQPIVLFLTNKYFLKTEYRGGCVSKKIQLMLLMFNNKTFCYDFDLPIKYSQQKNRNKKFNNTW